MTAEDKAFFMQSSKSLKKTIEESPETLEAIREKFASNNPYGVPAGSPGNITYVDNPSPFGERLVIVTGDPMTVDNPIVAQKRCELASNFLNVKPRVDGCVVIEYLDTANERIVYGNGFTSGVGNYIQTLKVFEPNKLRSVVLSNPSEAQFYLDNKITITDYRKEEEFENVVSTVTENQSHNVLAFPTGGRDAKTDNQQGYEPPLDSNDWLGPTAFLMFGITVTTFLLLNKFGKKKGLEGVLN